MSLSRTIGFSITFYQYGAFVRSSTAYKFKYIRDKHSLCLTFKLYLLILNLKANETGKILYKHIQKNKENYKKKTTTAKQKM